MREIGRRSDAIDAVTGAGLGNESLGFGEHEVAGLRQLDAPLTDRAMQPVHGCEQRRLQRMRVERGGVRYGAQRQRRQAEIIVVSIFSTVVDPEDSPALLERQRVEPLQCRVEGGLVEHVVLREHRVCEEPLGHPEVVRVGHRVDERPGLCSRSLQELVGPVAPTVEQVVVGEERDERAAGDGNRVDLLYRRGQLPRQVPEQELVDVAALPSPEVAVAVPPLPIEHQIGVGGHRVAELWMAEQPRRELVDELVARCGRGLLVVVIESHTHGASFARRTNERRRATRPVRS